MLPCMYGACVYMVYTYMVVCMVLVYTWLYVWCNGVCKYGCTHELCMNVHVACLYAICSVLVPLLYRNIHKHLYNKEINTSTTKTSTPLHRCST